MTAKIIAGVRNLIKLILILIVFVAILFIALPLLFPIKDSKLSSGLVFAEYFPQIGPNLEEAVVVGFDGKTFKKYGEKKYSKTTTKNPYFGMDWTYRHEIEEFKIKNNETITEAVFLTKDKKNMLVKAYKNDYISFDLWMLNLETKESEKISGKFSDYNCGEILNYGPERQEIYSANVEDIGSILFVEEFCIIDLESGKVLEKLTIPRETISLYPYFLDSDSNRLLVGENLIDLSELTIRKIQVAGWEDFEVFSYEFVNGKIILSEGLGKNEFVIYDIRNDIFSEKIVLEKSNNETVFYFVDVSPDFKYALFQEIGAGKDSACYVVVNLGILGRESYFCSKDIAEDGSKKSFYGWIVE